MNVFNKHAPAILFVSALLSQNILNAGSQPAGSTARKLVQAITNGSLRKSIVGIVALAVAPFRQHAPGEASTTFEPSTNKNNGAVPEEADQERRGQNRRLNTNVMSSIETTPAVHMQRTIEFLLAACQGQLEELKRLISQGVDINVVDNQGATALHIAASNGHLEVVKHLLSLEGVDINVVDNKGAIALHHAASNGHLEVLKYLLSQEDSETYFMNNLGGTALHYAAYNGHLAVLKYLLSQEDLDIHAEDIEGHTALYFAASNGHLDVLKHLLFQGAYIHAEGDQGFTALHTAAFYGRLDVLEYLLSEGADIKAVNNLGATALHIAASNGQLTVLKHLLSLEGSDIHVEDNQGATALHYAAYDGQLVVFKYLVSIHAKIRKKTNIGCTVLHVSAQGGHLEMVKHLQPHGSILGVNTLLAAYEGASGIDFIRSMINEDIGAVLSNLGPKPNMYENNRAAVLIDKILHKYFKEAMDLP